MAGRIIAKVHKKHCGKYVALRGFNSTKVVAYDKDPAKAYEKAKKKGVKNPVLCFIQDPNITYIYKHNLYL